jgi:hypothetical protein
MAPPLSPVRSSCKHRCAFSPGWHCEAVDNCACVASVGRITLNIPSSTCAKFDHAFRRDLEVVDALTAFRVINAKSFSRQSERSGRVVGTGISRPRKKEVSLTAITSSPGVEALLLAFAEGGTDHSPILRLYKEILP